MDARTRNKLGTRKRVVDGTIAQSVPCGLSHTGTHTVTVCVSKDRTVMHLDVPCRNAHPAELDSCSRLNVPTCMDIYQIMQEHGFRQSPHHGDKRKFTKAWAPAKLISVMRKGLHKAAADARRGRAAPKHKKPTPVWAQRGPKRWGRPILYANMLGEQASAHAGFELRVEGVTTPGHNERSVLRVRGEFRMRSNWVATGNHVVVATRGKNGVWKTIAIGTLRKFAAQSQIVVADSNGRTSGKGHCFACNQDYASVKTHSMTTKHANAFVARIKYATRKLTEQHAEFRRRHGCA